MSTFRTLSLLQPALVLGLALGLGACDEHHASSDMALIRSVTRPDVGGQAEAAALPGGALRESVQTYFGERFANEQRALMQQPQVLAAEAPTF